MHEPMHRIHRIVDDIMNKSNLLSSVCVAANFATTDPAFAAFVTQEHPSVENVTALLWQRATSGRFCTASAASWSLTQEVEGETVLELLL